MKPFSKFFVVCFFLISSNLFANEAYVVIHGGYSSCGGRGEHAGYDPMGTSFIDIFLKSLEEIRHQFAGVDVKFIAACFEGNFDSPPGNSSYYKVSRDLKKLKEITSGSFSDVFDAEEIAADTPIYLIGHSYGAWTMMNVAAQIGSRFNIRGLYTLDPIGPNDCSPWDAVWGSDGCFHAPTDLDNALIQEQTVEWVNFFQDTDMWLQSSKIDEADANWHVPYEWGDGHRDIDNDERVWKEILNSVTRTLVFSS